MLDIRPAPFESTFELDKRTYLPFVVVSHCPKCGEECEMDLRDNYLSYPTVGAPQRITFYHENDDGSNHHEWAECVVIGFTMTEVEQP